MFSVVDERSAGFFTLGMGKVAGRPAAVITTSGTAAANLYPSVIEASQGEVPLLVLTADRPHRLRDTDGNQAMDQFRLYGSFPRAFFEVAPPSPAESALRHLRGLAARAVSLSLGPPRGPVHLNFPFEKPLEPGRCDSPVSEREIPPGQEAENSRQPAEIEAGLGRPGGTDRDGGTVNVSMGRPMVGEVELEWAAGIMESARRGLIVAGPVPDPGEVGPAVLALADATGFPVLADPLSGARFGSKAEALVVGGYDLFLRSSEARSVLTPGLILRIGASPTSSAALDLISQSKGAIQLVVDDGHRWKDHLASARHYVRASPAPWLRRLSERIQKAPEEEWLALWREAENRTRSVLRDRGRAEVPGGGPGEEELLEGEILAAVVDLLPDGANLLVASSMPIRDLDAFGFPGPRELRLFGNRGVSGIDGLVSTTIGIAVGSGSEKTVGSGEEGTSRPTTVGVLGDLAFLHDMNGLQLLRSLQPGVVLVVVNNDGGGIFHTLPVREFEPAFTRFFVTPHGLDFEKAAGMYGIPYARADSLEDFKEGVSAALESGFPAVVEVRTDRRRTHEARRKLVHAVSGAMAGLGEADKDHGNKRNKKG
jgi:2-succinyl-5-enolpyruvyl-6-hydroxy-3-cyclohexene-1-carboxylate synthase